MAYVYAYANGPTYNLVHLYNVTHVYAVRADHLVLGNHIACHSLEKNFFSQILSLLQLPVILWVRLRQHGISTVHFDMSINVILVQFMLSWN